ncbi:hypothetical protein [Curtobacterium sp. VKM Ac-2884]|uniref:hypothetical protein n=1 Tax=Curtobacterium sp. VKM Ac-2884 TaxID=2783818 RepID=UPI00188AEBE8|nr:hypothetical protein [Curtobacterium sp. VKM Ac-2884]MBF4603454.1 hypothetical protein [Curtobacterium sp. VKM Ac-2884]
MVVAVAVVWQGIGTAVVGSTISPALSTFTTAVAFFGAASIALLVLVTREHGRFRPRERPTFREALVMNAVTAGAFGAFYIATTLIPSTAASVIETGLGPLIIVLILVRNGGRRAHGLVVPGLVILAAIVIAWIALHDDEEASGSGVVLGVALSILAGACAAGVLLSSHRIAGRGVSAARISAVRFHLAWALGAAIGLPVIVRGSFGPGELLFAAGVGVTCICIPILLLQWGVTLAEPVHAALVISMLPAVVLVGESFMTGVLQPALAFGMAVLVVFSLIGARLGR